MTILNASLSLLVFYVLWKAFTTYNRRAWIITVIHAVYLSVVWIAGFVSTAFIAKQKRITLMAVWTSVLASTMVGLFGSMQGLASYWAYSLMKRALNESSRAISFKFMLAIAVVLFLDVVRAFWNIANLFGVNVLDDLFTVLVVKDDPSAYAIYMTFFALVEAAPVAATIIILAGEDVEPNSDGYSILSNSGHVHSISQSLEYGAVADQKGLQNQGWASYPSAFDNGHTSSQNEYYDHTLGEDDFVTESESPYKTVDFHPGLVKSTPGYQSRYSESPTPVSFKSYGDSTRATGGSLPGNDDSGSESSGKRSKPGSRGRRASQLGHPTQLTESQSLRDYQRLAKIQVPHFGTITTPSGSQQYSASSSQIQTSSVPVQHDADELEGKFKDFHAMAKPASPSPPPSLLSSSPISTQGDRHTHSSSGVNTLTLPRTTPMTDISPSSSLTSPTETADQIPLSRLRSNR